MSWKAFLLLLLICVITITITSMCMLQELILWLETYLVLSGYLCMGMLIAIPSSRKLHDPHVLTTLGPMGFEIDMCVCVLQVLILWLETNWVPSICLCVGMLIA